MQTINSADEFFSVGESQGVDECSNCDDTDCPAHPEYNGPLQGRRVSYADLPEDMKNAVRQRWAAQHPGEEFPAENIEVVMGTAGSPEQVADLLGGLGADSAGIRERIMAALRGQQDKPTEEESFRNVTETILRLAGQYEGLKDRTGPMRQKLGEIERKIAHRRAIVVGELDAGEGLGSNDTQRAVRIEYAVESDERLSGWLDQAAELRAHITRLDIEASTSLEKMKTALKVVQDNLKHMEIKQREDELKLDKFSMVSPILSQLGTKDPKDIIEELAKLQRAAKEFEA